MTIRKEPSGRYRAVLKSGRAYVAGRTFGTRREAVAWLARERAALHGGVGPWAGRSRVRDRRPLWLDIRRTTVAAKTYRADTDLVRLTPPAVHAVAVASVSEREVARVYEHLLRSGLSEASVVRYRTSLSSFFAWCVRERLIVSNPVMAARVPRSSAEPTEMRPWNGAELEAAHGRWAARDTQLADVLLVLGWSGLRWGEARAVTVGDVLQVPPPGLLVQRSAPEGVATKATKGRRSLRVPIANRILPIIRGLAAGKEPDDLLLTTAPGARLHRGSVVRTVTWIQTAQGRRLHDLRHTAACLWLARGVDPGTVQTWMGHESIGTTNRYLRFLGTGADAAGLARLNEPWGHAGGTRGADDEDGIR